MQLTTIYLFIYSLRPTVSMHIYVYMHAMLKAYVVYMTTVA